MNISTKVDSNEYHEDDNLEEVVDDRYMRKFEYWIKCYWI